MTERIAVIGLGYVGLPVALALAKHFPGTLGFDVDKGKLEELARGEDRNHEVSRETLRATSLRMNSGASRSRWATCAISSVTTPARA